MDAKSIVQSYNKAKNKSISTTGNPKVDSIIQSYNIAISQPKKTATATKTAVKAPVKTTVPKATVPQTPMDRAKATLGQVQKKTTEIIKGLNLTFTDQKGMQIDPNKKVKPVTQEQIQQRAITLKPGQKKLDQKTLSEINKTLGVQQTAGTSAQRGNSKQTIVGPYDVAKKNFPQTMASVEGLIKNPLNTNPNASPAEIKQEQEKNRKVAIEAWNGVKESFIQSYATTMKVFEPNLSGGERAIREVESLNGMTTALFSILGAGFAVGNELPIIGTVTKALMIPFEALEESKAASRVSREIVKNLPMSDKNKKRIEPVITDALNLSAQITLGHFMGVGWKKAKVVTKKVGVDVFEKFTKNVIEEGGSARTINFTPKDVADIFRDKPIYGTQFLKELGLTSEQWRTAVKEGITIEIPAEKIVRIVDKPYWEKIKKHFKIAKDERVIGSKVKPTYKSGSIAGYLPEGKTTPQELINTIMQNNLDQTPEGKKIIQSAIEAQQSGQDIIIEKPKAEAKPSDLESSVKEKVEKVLQLSGNSLKDISIIGSTAKGKLNPNDLDILIETTNPRPTMTSENVHPNIEFNNVIRDELKSLFPDKKIHVTLSEYDSTKGPRMSLSDYSSKKSQARSKAEEYIAKKDAKLRTTGKSVTVYHGTPNPENIKSIEKDGFTSDRVFFSDSKEYADMRGGQNILTTQLDGSKFIDAKSEEYASLRKNNKNVEQALKDNGYDGVKFLHEADGSTEYVVYNKENLSKVEEYIEKKGTKLRVDETPKTVRVWNKSKFSNDGAYTDLPVIRKEENITLYQGGKAGDNRQFWTPDKKYAERFGNVKEKTGSFYKVDNGNRVTDVYVEAPSKSSEAPSKVEEYIEKKGTKLRKTITQNDVAEQKPYINLKRDVNIRDVFGNKSVIPGGEALSVYELKDGKILLKDGQDYLIQKGQFDSVKNNSIEAKGKEFAPELKQTEETILGGTKINKQQRRKEIEKAFEGSPYKIDEDMSGEAIVVDKAGEFVEPEVLEAEHPELFTLAVEYGDLVNPDNITGADTKYGQYTLPGGKDYQEILIRAPIEQIDNPVQNSYNDDTSFKSDAPTFKSSHWNDPNVIAHLRRNIRDFKNKKVYFVEEIQSDWAREARSKGTTKDSLLNWETQSSGDLRAKLGRREFVITKEGSKTYVYEQNGLLGRTVDDIETAKRLAQEKASQGRIPDNPLLKKWQELSIKKGLTDAVKRNDDYFAWVNGEQTSERYNLATHVEKVIWWQNGSGENKAIQIVPKDGKLIDIDVDPQSGEIVKALKPEWEGKKLDEVLGKGLADKIMEQEDGTLSGDGLKFGGEWAINLYDKQVKSIVEDLTGGKVEVLDMGLPIDKTVEKWHVGTDAYAQPLTTSDSLKVGDEIGRTINAGGGLYSDDAYIITNVLGNGKVKAVPSRVSTSAVGMEAEGERGVSGLVNFNSYSKAQQKIIVEELSETIDLSGNKSKGQQAIRLTPEIKKIIKGEAPDLKQPSGIAFRIKDDLAKKGIDITDAQEKEIMEVNKRIFGDEDVKITAQIIANQEALGKYEKGMIEILDGQADPKDTLYHEAVHKYLDVFTTKEEQIAILMEGQEKYGTEDFAQVEENIAEDFIKFAKSREGFVGKLREMFAKLIEQIKKYFSKKSEIDKLYNDIMTGKAKEKLPDDELFKPEIFDTLAESPAAVEAVEADTPKAQEIREKISGLKENLEQRRQENEAKKSILDQFSGKQIQAMRTMKRAMNARIEKGMDPATISETQTYKDHIWDVMSAIGTNSEAEALRYIQEDLPDPIVQASTRELLAEIKVLRSHIKPKEVGVPRSQIPVGEGKEKASRLEARMKGILKKATPMQIDDLGLATYKQMNKEEMIEKATNYAMNNRAEALQVLQGKKDVPEGLIPEAIYVALVNEASGDLTLATKLASLQATALGQRISILSELDTDSPVKIMNEVYKVREEQFKKRFGGKTQKEATERVAKDITKRVKKPDRYDWNKFLDSITC